MGEVAFERRGVGWGGGSDSLGHPLHHSSMSIIHHAESAAAAAAAAAPTGRVMRAGDESKRLRRNQCALLRPLPLCHPQHHPPPPPPSPLFFGQVPKIEGSQNKKKCAPSPTPILTRTRLLSISHSIQTQPRHRRGRHRQSRAQVQIRKGGGGEKNLRNKQHKAKQLYTPQHLPAHTHTHTPSYALPVRVRSPEHGDKHARL